ncbi:MAG TPA: lipid-A-disaccharide synthase [Planctomycetaceae bacterium]|nr:lipid-A-disaccharide synthase [Planctomycetaceae bacterium]
MRIFFSVGEPSGDQHAAHLLQELRRRQPELDGCGFGGPLMAQAGCDLLYRLTDLAVMGFARVIPMLGKFLRLVKVAERSFREAPPDAVVLVDFPGFNWWIARKAHGAGIPVFYYLPPQLWAWAPWRIKRVRRFVDHVLCTLPFEYDWYVQQGVSADYVGHPFFDEVAERPLDRAFLHRWSSNGARLVAVLPGSRQHELTHNWPLMVEILRRVHARHRDVHFLVACYREQHQQFCRQRVETQAPDLPIDFFVGKTSEIIELAECALMVSGSVSLEMLARGTPALVLYHVGWTTFFLARHLIHCHYMSLPNLMAGYEVLPEYPAVGRSNAEIGQISDRLKGWLARPERLQTVRKDLADLRDGFARTGATERAAEILLSRIAARRRRRAA